MDLTPQERERIYLEEKARLEAQNRLRDEAARLDADARNRARAAQTRRQLRILGVIGGIFLFVALIGVLTSHSGRSSEPAKTPTPPPEADSLNVFDAMTPGQHLDAADHDLFNGMKEYRGAPGGFWGKLDDARKHLEAIPQAAAELTAAKRLMREVVKREKNRSASVAHESAKLQQSLREGFAKDLERDYLEKGMDVHVTLRDKAKTTLEVKWVLISRPLAYKLANDSSFLQNARNLGFKKVVLTDGYNETWSFSVK